jgi:hypothetical protein
MSAATTVNDVITKEYIRLNEKKIEADAAVSAQQRAVLLNESYKKRFSKYIQIIMIISIALIVYLGIISFKNSLSFIPEWVLDMITGVLFAGTAIYCIIIAQDIWTRSVINFDELDLPPYVPAETSTQAMTTLDQVPNNIQAPSTPAPSTPSPSPIFGPIPTGVISSEDRIAGVGLKDAFTLITK